MEVLRQGTVSDEACTLLYADHMPRVIGVQSQQARSRPSCRSGFPREDLELVCLSPAAQVQENDEETGPGIRKPVPDLREGETWE